MPCLQVDVNGNLRTIFQVCATEDRSMDRMVQDKTQSDEKAGDT